MNFNLDDLQLIRSVSADAARVIDRAQNTEYMFPGLDLSSTDDPRVEFVPAKRAAGLPYAEAVKLTRQSIKFGRFLRSLAPHWTEGAIRIAVTAIKGALNDDVIAYDVGGEDVLRHFMIPKNRSEGFGDSCYQGAANPYYFELFKNNPEKLRLVVAWRENKLVGRGILFFGNKADGTPIVLIDNPIGDPRGRQRVFLYARQKYQALGVTKKGYGPVPQPAADNCISEAELDNITIDLKPGMGLHHWNGLMYDPDAKKIKCSSYTTWYSEPYMWAHASVNVWLQTNTYPTKPEII